MLNIQTEQKIDISLKKFFYNNIETIFKSRKSKKEGKKGRRFLKKFFLES